MYKGPIVCCPPTYLQPGLPCILRNSVLCIGGRCAQESYRRARRELAEEHAEAVVLTPQNDNFRRSRLLRGHTLPPISFLADYNQLSMQQLESQCSLYLVQFSQKQVHHLLTNAMHLSDIAAHTVGFVIENQHLIRKDPASGPSIPQKALLLGWERDRTAVARMIGVVTLLSILAGILVGVLLHDASLGIAASSGLAAVLSCVEIFFFWQFR
jgi:hypothetical protein